MVKLTKPTLFLLIFVLVVWPLGFLTFKAKSPETKKIANIVSSEGFLSTLQNTASDACLAMTYMDRVDVVIVGSSLAYADIDPLVLSEQFAGQSVAVCAFPGWNTDFFDMFFKVIMFSGDIRNRTAQKWVETLGTEELSANQLKEYRDGIERHSSLISGLSDSVVTQIILETEFRSEAAANVILKTAMPLPRNENKLQKLCANLRQRSVVLDIVVAPMPTTSDAARLTEFYEISDGEEGNPIVNYYKDNAACARTVISDSLAGWGLDNRYYLNRNLRDDYPYDLWEAPDSFRENYEALPDREQLRFYDSSHLNGVGATIFTKSLAERLK